MHSPLVYNDKQFLLFLAVVANFEFPPVHDTPVHSLDGLFGGRAVRVPYGPPAFASAALSAAFGGDFGELNVSELSEGVL